VHKIIFKYNPDSDDICRIVSTVNYFKEHLNDDTASWEIGVVADTKREDEECL